MFRATSWVDPRKERKQALTEREEGEPKLDCFAPTAFRALQWQENTGLRDPSIGFSDVLV